MSCLISQIGHACEFSRQDHEPIPLLSDFGLVGLSDGSAERTESTIAITQATWDNAIVNKAVLEYLRKIGSKGGSVSSSQKAKAARKNGKLGGRPRKKGNRR